LDEEIRHAIAISKIVIILLISPNFLSAQYIRQTVLPLIFQDNSKKIIPILIKACSWKAIEQFRDIQMLPNDGQPLWSDNDSESFIPHSRIEQITSYIEKLVKKIS